MKNTVFLKTTKALEDILYSEISTQNGYIKVKGKINKPWYNLIVPIDNDNLIGWEHIKPYFNQHDNYSLYLNKAQKKKFQLVIKEKKFQDFGKDTYIYEELEKKKEVKISDDIKPIKTNIKTYLEIAKCCFSEWTEIVEYSKLFFNQKNCFNFIRYIKKKPAGISSLVIDKKQNICYMHNFATKKEFRRRGVFKDFVNHARNLCLKNNINTLCAIVEPESASHKGYKSLGLTHEVTYELFVKN